MIGGCNMIEISQQVTNQIHRAVLGGAIAVTFDHVMNIVSTAPSIEHAVNALGENRGSQALKLILNGEVELQNDDNTSTINTGAGKPGLKRSKAKDNINDS